ncbi:hypothetical protein LDENG_00238040 [Lucifuga dentata]|nr:hypothetical protein LDENG_00238040 [Lucifuga dentata]
MGAHYYPPEVHPDHRTHRYRSFMIEEILTDHPEHKVSAPAGELLKFGVQALLAARPFHSQLAASHHLPLDLHLRGKLEHGADGGSKSKKGRRSRTVFTELQLMGLEKRFEKQKYLSTPDRIDLAESLGLSQLQVKTWYQNRRMKWKKIVLQGGGLESPTKPKGRPKKNSIPTSEQLSEQERSAADGDPQSDTSSVHLDASQDD